MGLFKDEQFFYMKGTNAGEKSKLRMRKSEKQKFHRHF